MPSAVSWVKGMTPRPILHNAYRRAKEIFAILFPDGQPDVVIFDQFYPLLKPCFLDYDAEEMARRYGET